MDTLLLILGITTTIWTVGFITASYISIKYYKLNPLKWYYCVPLILGWIFFLQNYQRDKKNGRFKDLAQAPTGKLFLDK